jgi:hypothetical protein
MRVRKGIGESLYFVPFDLNARRELAPRDRTFYEKRAHARCLFRVSTIMVLRPLGGQHFEPSKGRIGRAPPAWPVRCSLPIHFKEPDLRVGRLNQGWRNVNQTSR